MKLTSKNKPPIIYAFYFFLDISPHVREVNAQRKRPRALAVGRLGENITYW